MRNTSMIEMRVTKPSTPRIVGMMTLRCVCNGDAPSMFADSRSSIGTPCKPAKMISIANGSMCHTVFAMMRAALGTWSVNHSTSLPPISPMNLLTMPPKLSSNNQEKATAPTRFGST
ncbi:hypothetical protein ABIB56_001026 [Glaciihabitans sp. UYNi722]